MKSVWRLGKSNSRAACWGGKVLVFSQAPKSIDTKNDGVFRCISFETWLFWVSMWDFRGVWETFQKKNTNGHYAPPPQKKARTKMVKLLYRTGKNTKHIKTRNRSWCLCGKIVLGRVAILLVTFLGWWKRDLQPRDKKVTAWITWGGCFLLLLGHRARPYH